MLDEQSKNSTSQPTQAGDAARIGKPPSSAGLQFDMYVHTDPFFNISPDMMFVYRLDGCFVKINPAASRILGYTEAEFSSKPFIEFVHPDDRQATSDCFVKVLREGLENFRFENRYLTASGRYVWMSWCATPPTRATC